LRNFETSARKLLLAKKIKHNRPLPEWFRVKTDTKIRYNAKRRHCRRAKIGLREGRTSYLMHLLDLGIGSCDVMSDVFAVRALCPRTSQHVFESYFVTHGQRENVRDSLQDREDAQD